MIEVSKNIGDDSVVWQAFQAPFSEGLEQGFKICEVKETSVSAWCYT